MGQVWGWGYGGEGQLGLGSRVKMVSTPHVISCIEPPLPGKDRSSAFSHDSKFFSAQASKVPGNFVKEIACGGRHSAIITVLGHYSLLAGVCTDRCGQGGTYDQLRPTYVNSLSAVRVEKIAAGLWHTLCVSDEGRVYAFGGNQFGQLGTGADQAESLPKLLDPPCLEGKNAKMVSCGARHSIISTGTVNYLAGDGTNMAKLGLGDSVDRSTPSQVSITVMPRNIACGWWHTLLLAETPI
ncbi:Regulator of chromosome condensation 1/beta-lactamase-inhibitor protein II [Trema orientale]|uniref:Regulator of chromosome condensation 1/beta-lactamase-inhibitor protein II n=1 Tax=Trema orientale TaxID=63057 RepID=A0A2P5EZ52_TREOI|nr:Regulator of chromosome condensation 1/beta-lactamase-inhibitor protein II [Trema orientale]